MLLEESLHLMKEQRMDEFGQAVILYLVNHAKIDQTRMSPTAETFVLLNRWLSLLQPSKIAMKLTVYCV